MNQVWELLQQPDMVTVFDIDGTLFSYNYGTRKAHHDLDTGMDEEEFRKIDMYAEAKGLPVIREYLRGRDLSRCYCLSMEPHGHEEGKAEAIRAYYGIPVQNCIFVDRSEDKVQKLLELSRRIGCPHGKLVYIDDNELVLRQVEEETDFITAHVTIFFEEH